MRQQLPVLLSWYIGLLLLWCPLHVPALPVRKIVDSAAENSLLPEKNEEAPNKPAAPEPVPESVPESLPPRFSQHTNQQTTEQEQDLPVSTDPKCATFVCVSCGTHACCPCGTQAPRSNNNDALLNYPAAQGQSLPNPIQVPNPMVWRPCDGCQKRGNCKDGCRGPSEHVIIDDTEQHFMSPILHTHHIATQASLNSKRHTVVVKQYNHARFILRINMLREADIRNRLHQLAMLKAYLVKQLGMLDEYLVYDMALRADTQMHVTMSSKSSSSTSRNTTAALNTKRPVLMEEVTPLRARP